MSSVQAKQDKINAAYELLQGGTISLDAFSQVVTLLKGLHPELDKKLAVSSELLGKVQKIQNGDVISLTADVLPEETEEDKKRKKALVFFINSINNLKSEIKRVEKELQTDKSPNTYDKIVYGAKGPFGIITIIAVIIVAISLYALPKNNTNKQQTVVAAPTKEAASTKVKVIMYQGKSIPLSEFYVGHGPDCGEGGVPHYHAPNEETVKALDGTVFQDPGGCGFGKVNDTQVVEIEITHIPR